VKAEIAPGTYVSHCPGAFKIIIRLPGFTSLLWEFFEATFAELVAEFVCYTRC